MALIRESIARGKPGYANKDVLELTDAFLLQEDDNGDGGDYRHGLLSDLRNLMQASFTAFALSSSSVGAAPLSLDLNDTYSGSSWVVGDFVGGLSYSSNDASGVGAGLRARIGFASGHANGNNTDVIIQTAPSAAGTLVTQITIDGVTGETRFAASPTIDFGSVAGNPRLYFDHDNFGSNLFYIQADRNNDSMDFIVNGIEWLNADSTGAATFLREVNFERNIVVGGSGGYYIRNDVDTANLVISGGTASNIGANIAYYGGSHGSLAGDIRERSGANLVRYYDASATTHSFYGHVALSSGSDFSVSAARGIFFDGYGGHTYIKETANDVLSIYRGGSLAMVLNGGLNFYGRLINTTYGGSGVNMVDLRNTHAGGYGAYIAGGNSVAYALRIGDYANNTLFEINSATTTISTDVVASDHNIFADIWTHAGPPSIYARNQHASFSGPLFRGDVSRSASSAFSYFRGYSNSVTDTEFHLRGDGNGYCDGSWSGGGADYAEYFEWLEEFVSSDPRHGVSVVLENGMMRPASQGEIPFAVISANPSVVGDSKINYHAKYLRTVHGGYALDSNGERVLNPDYDPSLAYIPREERDEWGVAGLVGKLRVNKDSVIAPNWIKMRDINDEVAEYFTFPADQYLYAWKDEISSKVVSLSDWQDEKDIEIANLKQRVLELEQAAA